MNKLLKSLFLRLFWSRVGGEDEEGGEAEGEGELPDLEGEGGEGSEGEGEGGEEEGEGGEVEAVSAARPESRAAKEIRTLRERAQAAETARIAAEAKLEEARRGGAKPEASTGTKTQEQELWEQEEAILKNPDAESWHKYSINAAREARAARAESQRAALNAADAADRAEFAKLEASKPKTYAKYAPKVEEMLQSMRKSGNNAPRSELLALMLGRDLLNGSAKPEKAPAKQTGGAQRGKTPGAKTDVATTSMSSRLSEAEKRAKRLENVRI